MQRLLISTVLCGCLSASAPLQAFQGPGGFDPDALVRSWYLQFLDREYDAAGTAFWTSKLRQGAAPEVVLASLLSSPEYQIRAGETPEDFVRTVLVDLTGREPAEAVVREWSAQADASNYDEVARALVEQYPQSWQIPADPVVREYLTNIHANARDLAFEIERLQEDIVEELRGKKERTLYAQADEVLYRLREFRRLCKVDVPREDLYGSFSSLDDDLHALLETVLAMKSQPVLQRVAARVERADEGLHYAVSAGDDSDERGQEVIVRQTRALLAEVRGLEQTARYALADAGDAEQLYDSLAQYSAAVDHFHKTAKKGFDRDHQLRDFAEVGEAWLPLSQQINAVQPSSGHGHLRRRAQAVDAIHNRLDRALGVETERPRVVFRYGKGKAARR